GVRAARPCCIGTTPTLGRRRRFCGTPWAGCVQQVGERQHRAGGGGRARGVGGDPGCAAAVELDRRGTRRGKAGVALSLGGASSGGGDEGVWIGGTRNPCRAGERMALA